MVPGVIHDDHPFRTPPGDRDPVRRFRGRLAAPVTVFTAGGPGAEAALTVSSLIVAEGEPSYLIALVGTTTDLWDAIQGADGKFIVHVLPAERRDDADAFAGVRPRPGGVFTGVDIEPTEWGPALVGAPNRLYCRMESAEELPYHQLIRAVIESVVVADLDDPAVYFRGEHRRLAGH